MEVKHFSHDHPLMLNQGHKDDGGEVPCYACVRRITGPSYGCIPCQYFLHKSCAELPMQMTHPSHPEHPLTLLPNPPSHYEGLYACDICLESFNRFVYHCGECNFDVDINCASMVQSIQQRVEHRSHGHLLTPLRIPATFLCQACGTNHEGTSYLCTTCGFWINQKCASLPSTITLGNHDHPLTLLYSIPYEYFQSMPECEICDHNVYRRSWVYYCSGCSYFVHVNCATAETGECKPKTEQQDLHLNLIEFISATSGVATSNTELSKSEIKAKNLDPNLITLPVPDESVDAITQFIKYIRLQGKYTEATEISHVSHDHPLIFINKQIDDESCFGSKLPLSNAVLKSDDEKCKGCAKSISAEAPFYQCAQDQCKYTLHQWCAELPDVLQHPCHVEHPLLLITQQQQQQQQSSSNFDPHRCKICQFYCDGFIFGCPDCKFYLDSKCASLPRIIRHEAHKQHILALRRSGFGCCSACDEYLIRFVFACDLCNFNLCIRCALLPRTVTHRYDEHPFTLTYSPLKDQPDEYYCEICEEEIKSEYWFYHCVNCDQSLHTKCIRPVDDPVDDPVYISGIKYGLTFDIDHLHHHLLTLVRSLKDNSSSSSCGKCGGSSKDMWGVLECAPCNFWIHMMCAAQQELHKKIW